MHSKRLISLLILGLLPLAFSICQAQPDNRVTILVDAFGKPSSLKQDWGFSALIEYEGKRILFDTGNDANLFAHNIRSLKLDLTRLDFVVLSHRHGDHTDGLRYLLKVNPQVKIYTPVDEYFGGPTPPIFFRQPVTTLPAHMRYFNGSVPPKVPHGTPWKEANITRVDSTVEVMPGIRLVSNLAPGKAFGETPELSLSIRTPKGQVLVVGCSHPGIEQILGSASAKQTPVSWLIGGLHLVTTPDAEIRRLVAALHDEWQVTEVAPGHCTGEVAFSALQQTYADHYHYAGVGSVIQLP